MSNNIPFLPLGMGKLITVKPSDPAAGTDFSFAAPVHSIILPVSLSFVLLTAAGGGTRTVLIATNDGTDNIFITNSTFLHSGGVSRQYVAQAGGNLKDSASGFSFQFLNMSIYQYLRFGDSLVSIVTGIESGDQISSIKIRFMQWIQE